MKTVRWRDLNVGDIIICPVSGLPEKVTSTHHYANGRWFVRTNRHDHMRPAVEQVNVQEVAR